MSTITWIFSLYLLCKMCVQKQRNLKINTFVDRLEGWPFYQYGKVGEFELWTINYSFDFSLRPICSNFNGATIREYNTSRFTTYIFVHLNYLLIFCFLFLQLYPNLLWSRKTWKFNRIQLLTFVVPRLVSRHLHFSGPKKEVTLSSFKPVDLTIFVSLLKAHFR